MANGKFDRSEGYPSLGARAHWRSYAAGMGTEAVFIGMLTLVGFVLAVIAKVIWP